MGGTRAHFYYTVRARHFGRLNRVFGVIASGEVRKQRDSSCSCAASPHQGGLKVTSAEHSLCLGEGSGTRHMPHIAGAGSIGVCDAPHKLSQECCRLIGKKGSAQHGWECPIPRCAVRSRERLLSPAELLTSYLMR